MDEYTGGVPFPVSEEEDSYSENISTSSWTPRITLRCPYANRYDLVEAVSYRAWPFSSAGPVFSPRATGFTIAGDGVPNDGAKNLNTEAFEYIDALVTVTYEQAVGGGGANNSFDFFTETVEPTIEYLRYPHTHLFWSGGDPGEISPLSPEQTPGFPVYRERYTRTYFGITLPVPAPFTALQNSINTNPVVSPILGITYDPLTVLYGNRRINYNLRTDGTQSANLSVDFTYRQEGWRRYWNFERQAFEEIETIDGTPIAFPPANDLSPVLLS